MYAVGQGALAVECREGDTNTLELLRPLYDIKTALRVITERSFLKTLGGGCSAPVAVYTNLTNTTPNEHKITVTGAVWSLDGKDEIVESDECIMEFEGMKMCAACPYKNNRSNLEDIESLKDCLSKCPNKKESPPVKRVKLDNIPTELLKTDPHEHCPIQLPVGADFMGKCPFLEANLAVGDAKVIEHTSNLNITKCPYFKQGKLLPDPVQREDGCSLSENDDLFCGLVPHSDINIKAFRDAENLGKRLANALVKCGALDIMRKAQETVHNSVTVTGDIPVTLSTLQ